MGTLGTMATDCEIRIDYDKLRKDRLRKTQDQVRKDGLGALLAFDHDAIRYITSTKLNDWMNNKLARAALVSANQQPILYEAGSAIEAKKALCPWIADRIFPFTGGAMRGSFPRAVVYDHARGFAKQIKSILKEWGVDKEPLGIDIMEVPFAQALMDEGIKIVDGQQTILEAQKIKTKEEVDLIELSIALDEAAFWEVVSTARPGMRENEVNAIVRKRLYELGAEEIQNVNVISGNRSQPHPHDASDRMLRMGDMLYIDIVSVFNGYHTCYYQTFVIGPPSAKQERIYRTAYDWLFKAAEMLRPGISTADIAAVWPSAAELGMKSEAEAFALQLGHGIGITHWAKPVISRWFSFDHPEVLEEGMVFALETYYGEDGDGARIEEMFVVEKNGYRQLSRFPSKHLISCPTAGNIFPRG